MICRIFGAKRKITSLNDNCLERIFDYLELKDLLNVADSNKRLKSVADMVFALKFSERELNFIDYTPILGSNFITSPAEIHVGDVKSSLQLLRCFGHSISRIAINRNESKINHPKDCANVAFSRILLYVNEFCSESLTKINIQGGASCRIDRLENAFVKVETVHICNCEISNEVQLSALFPQVRRMYLYGIQITDWKSIGGNFSRLDDLKVYRIRLNKTEFEIFNSKYCAAILKSNPKLKVINDSPVPTVCLLFDISFSDRDSVRSI